MLAITKALYEDYLTVARGCVQSKKLFTVWEKLLYYIYWQNKREKRDNNAVLISQKGKQDRNVM